MDDNFLPIEDYPGYRISQEGRVESCWSRYARPARMTDAWHSLVPFDNLGYPTINLSKGGVKKQFRIHRLVLEAFAGPCPEGFVACHNDGDPTNNALSNLRWDTPLSNSADALRHGTRARGERCNAKLKGAEVLMIRRSRAEGANLGDLAVEYGVSRKNIEAIVYRQSWRHLHDTHVGEGIDGPANLADEQRPGATA